MSTIKTIICFGYVLGIFWNNVQSFSPDYYGGLNGMDMDMEDDRHFPPRSEEDFDHSLRQKRTRDVLEAKDGIGNEIYSGTKRFKLYEKKSLTYEKAKAFCKKREGKLAQAMNVEEMSRLQTLITKAKAVSRGLWIDADKREWKKHSSKMLGMQPNLGPNAHMIRGGGPTAMCPTLSLSTRSLTPNACYENLPFICEYQDGKGPKKKGQKNSTVVKKKKRSEEMRKKREIVELEQIQNDTAAVNVSSSTQSPLELETDNPDNDQAEPRFLPESDSDAEIILDDNDHLVLDEFTPVEKEEMINESAAHNVGFKPHVIAAENPKTPYPYPSITTFFPPHNNMQEYPSPRMFVKVSTNYTVQDPLSEPESPSLEIGQDFDVVERVDNELNENGNSNGNANVNMQRISTEKHPDQQMVDLFDEQIENMKISDLVEPEPESESPESVTSVTTGKPLANESPESESVTTSQSLVNVNSEPMDNKTNSATNATEFPKRLTSTSTATEKIDSLENSTFMPDEYELVTNLPDVNITETLNITFTEQVNDFNLTQQNQKLENGSGTGESEKFENEANFTSKFGNESSTSSSREMETMGYESGMHVRNSTENSMNDTSTTISTTDDVVDPNPEAETQFGIGTSESPSPESATSVIVPSPNSKMNRLLVRLSEESETGGADPEPESSKSHEIHIDELPLLNKLVAG